MNLSVSLTLIAHSRSRRINVSRSCSTFAEELHEAQKPATNSRVIQRRIPASLMLLVRKSKRSLSLYANRGPTVLRFGEMSQDRWVKIEETFHAALELPVPERSAFLNTACAGD